MEELLERLRALCPDCHRHRHQYVRGQGGEPGAGRRSRRAAFEHARAYPGAFHGSGDIFAAAYGALLVRGAALGDALECATSLVSDSFARTYRSGKPRHYGSDFEGALPAYAARVEALFRGK